MALNPAISALSSSSNAKLEQQVATLTAQLAKLLEVIVIDQAGNVTLKSGKVRIESNSDVVIASKGNTTIDSLMNVTIKSAVAVSVKGSASAELSAAGHTV